MDFLLEMLLMAILSLFFAFLLSVAMAGNSGGGRGNDRTSDQVKNPDISTGRDEFVTKELRFAPVVESERNLRVVDENVETVDRYGIEAVTENEESRIPTAEAESTAAVSPEIVIAESVDTIVRGQDEAGEIGGAEQEELIIRTMEAVSTACVSPETVVVEEAMIREQDERGELVEGRNGCVEVENEESGHVVVAESEEVRVESSNAVEENDNKECNTEKEKEELVIEEHDDWEGIERSELEKDFAAAANYLEESGKAEQIGDEAKLELYGLHKIATEGSCREAQPMAVMVSARARWNAWQKLGNMNQEEAMEQYLALVSKEIPTYNEL